VKFSKSCYIFLDKRKSTDGTISSFSCGAQYLISPREPFERTDGIVPMLHQFHKSTYQTRGFRKMQIFLLRKCLDKRARSTPIAIPKEYKFYICFYLAINRIMIRFTRYEFSTICTNRIKNRLFPLSKIRHNMFVENIFCSSFYRCFDLLFLM
jgi:hypothetical protein